MRHSLFYIIYAIIVSVLFAISVALTAKFEIPVIGPVLAFSIGIAISTGKIRLIVESIVHFIENEYYYD